MANITTDTDAEHAAAVRRRYLVRFEIITQPETGRQRTAGTEAGG
jgi:hypothetical protein